MSNREKLQGVGGLGIASIFSIVIWGDRLGRIQFSRLLAGTQTGTEFTVGMGTPRLYWWTINDRGGMGNQSKCTRDAGSRAREKWGAQAPAPRLRACPIPLVQPR